MKPGSAALLILSSWLMPSFPQERLTFSVKAAEVQIAATVKDKGGKPITHIGSISCPILSPSSRPCPMPAVPLSSP
jgi:hypothetical protein